MRYRLLEPARNELQDAQRWYDQQRAGLSEDLLQDVEQTIARILQNPLGWPVLSNRARYCRAKRFPYMVVYFVESDEVLVVAVMHLHRRPGYWSDRVS